MFLSYMILTYCNLYFHIIPWKPFHDHGKSTILKMFTFPIENGDAFIAMLLVVFWSVCIHQKLNGTLPTDP